MGCAGGLAGYVLGTSIGLTRQEDIRVSFLDPRLFLLTSCTAVVLSLAASWAPVYYAAQQDPAEVLREE
jgi:ABC-type antimicrobial peptide transport system permease subunit